MTHFVAPRLSCRLEVLPGNRVADQLASARRFSFAGVALPGRFLDRWLNPLRECRADRPVALAGISLGFKGSLLSPHESARRECRDSLLRLFDLCAELKAGWVNMPPCLNQDNPERITDPGRFGSLEERLDALLLEQLPALADAARDRGVILLIEPVNREETEYLTSVDHAARLVAKANHPALGCTADFFHMQIEGHGMAEEIERSAAFIRHVHVASITRVEPGPGPLDFNPGFRALKAAGYAGWLEVECRKLSGPPDEVLPKSADYLRQTWRTA